MLSIARSLAMVASNNTVVFQFGPDHDKLLALGAGTPSASQPVIYMVILALIHRFRAALDQVRPPRLRHRRNEHAATLTGVPVRPIKVAVYMFRR